MKRKIWASLLHVVPQKAISSLIGKAAKSRVSRRVIPFYARMYQVPLHEMEKPLQAYTHLTEFFTRRLRTNARTIDEKENAVISPVDGTLSSFGKVNNDTLIQAKGISYSLRDLLGDVERAKRYENGTYLTIYLSPKDYHRIHVPFDGCVTQSTYIPGRLYPVNRIGVEGVAGLFTKNERMITYFETNECEMALVKVGAFIVGSVQVNYPLTAITRKQKQTEHDVFAPPLAYQKGEELGYFEFGSTVILLFEPNGFELNPALKERQTLQFGETIGQKK